MRFVERKEVKNNENDELWHKNIIFSSLLVFFLFLRANMMEWDAYLMAS